MKSKTIKKILGKKVKEWLETVTDETLRKDLQEGVIVTGGCITSLLLNEEVNDFDVYFTTQQLAARVAQYYVTQFMEKTPEAWKDSDGRLGKQIEVRVVQPSEGVRGSVKIFVNSAGVIGEDSKKYEYFEGTPEGDSYIEDSVRAVDDADSIQIETDNKKKKDDPKKAYRAIFLANNSITLFGKIQLVLRFWGNPEEIHANYDFVHCTNYWTSKDNELVLHGKALECILAKELIYQGSLYPVCSIFRVRKFIQRGWTITAGQLLKMMLQVSKLDLSKVEVLEDQLVGVDAVYFLELMSKLKEQDPEKVDGAYLVELLDQMI